MAGRRVGPAVVRKRLGRELRKLRTAAGLRIEDVASEMEFSTAKISRLESGLGTPKTWDVRNLLTLFRVTDAHQVKRVLDWAEQSKASGWWESDADLAHDDLDRGLALETEAVGMLVYCTPVFPAIVQAERYARFLISTLYPDLDDGDIERLVNLRMTRQEILTRDPEPLRPTIVVDEAVLHRVVGSRDVLDEQLRATVDRMDGGQVELRVFPFGSGSPGRAVSPFTIYLPRVADVDPVVAQVENSTGEQWHDDSDDVDELRALFVELTSRALDPGESRTLILRAVS